MVVQDVGSSQGEFVTQVAGAGEREFPVIPVMFRLRSCREVKKRRGWRIRSQSVLKLHALLLIWLSSRLSLAETLSRMGINVPCLENVPLSLLMRRMKMWMSLGAVPRCIVIWNPRGSSSESVSHAFLRDLSGALDTSSLPVLKVLNILIITLL